MSVHAITTSQHTRRQSRDPARRREREEPGERETGRLCVTVRVVLGERKCWELERIGERS